MIKYIYSVFIGLLLATSIGIGVSAFYAAPQAPDYPAFEKYIESPASELSEDELQQRKNFEAAQEDHNERMNEYNRNVSLIVVGFALLVLIASLLLLTSIHMIADGLLLGGVFALVYGIGRSFGSGEQKFMFATVTFGLLVALLLGYIKFIKPTRAES